MNNTLRERLQIARKAKGLSQRALASLVPCEVVSVWRYEAREVSPSVPTLVRLAEVLSVTPDWLLGFKSPDEQQHMTRIIAENGLLKRRIREIARDLASLADEDTE